TVRGRHHRSLGIPQGPRALQHFARIRIRDERLRLVERQPATRGNTLVRLWTRAALRGAHQVEVAGLVDRASAEAEVPVYGLQLRHEHQPAEPRLFGDLAHGCRIRPLTALEVAFREAPVAIAVADEEHARRAVV